MAADEVQVAHLLADIPQTDGKLIRIIGQVLASSTKTLMGPCYKLWQLTCFQNIGIAAFRRPTWAESSSCEAIQGESEAPMCRSVTASRGEMQKLREEAEPGSATVITVGFTDNRRLFEAPACPCSLFEAPRGPRATSSAVARGSSSWRNQFMRQPRAGSASLGTAISTIVFCLPSALRR